MFITLCEGKPNPKFLPSYILYAMMDQANTLRYEGPISLVLLSK